MSAVAVVHSKRTSSSGTLSAAAVPAAASAAAALPAAVLTGVTGPAAVPLAVRVRGSKGWSGSSGSPLEGPAKTLQSRLLHLAFPFRYIP